MTDTLLGVGIYTIPEASRLVRIDQQTVRRWVKGYSYKSSQGKKITVDSFINSSIPDIDNKFTISFLELMELCVVKMFLKEGVSLRIIRKAAKEASELFHVNNPFAYKIFTTDGIAIFWDDKTQINDKELLELGTRKFAFRKILGMYTHEIEFDDITIPNKAIRWFPMGKEHSIVIDPAISFGEPVIESTRILAESIYNDYLAEQSVATVAYLYDLNNNNVEDAITFMKGLSAA
jgi:uncharacterized protein (DUF433 family)